MNKKLPIVLLYYILLWVLARISKWTFRLCQYLKKIDSIWVILKKSKSWKIKKEERNLDKS